jgi:hypothetical protein
MHSEGALWESSAVNKIGRLFQGLGEDSKIPLGTNTCFFIPPSDVPSNIKPTYVRIVAAFRPKKDDPRRIRWTAGNTSTKTADLTTVKILANSVIFTKNCRFSQPLTSRISTLAHQCNQKTLPTCAFPSLSSLTKLRRCTNWHH